MDNSKLKNALKRGTISGLTLLAVAGSVGLAKPAAANSFTPLAASTVVKKADKKTSSSSAETGVGYNQLSKSEKYAGGNYHTSNNPGIKAVGFKGQVTLSVETNHDWVITVAEGFSGEIPLYFMKGKDDNNSYHSASIVLNGEGGRFFIGTGTDMQSLYFGSRTDVDIAFDRYVTYVNIWNDIYTTEGIDAEIKTILSDAGGLDHYYALLDAYKDEADKNGGSLPPYYHFDISQEEQFNNWADKLENGLVEVMTKYNLDNVANLSFPKELIPLMSAENQKQVENFTIPVK